MNHESESSSSGLAWASGILTLIVVCIGAAYFWTLQEQPATPQPVFVNIGEVKAYAGNRRMVHATVTLEVTGKKHEARVAERLSRAKIAITNSFAEFTEGQLTTHDGKVALQERIREELNELLGKRAVREVLFTSFVMSIS